MPEYSALKGEHLRMLFTSFPKGERTRVPSNETLICTTCISGQATYQLKKGRNIVATPGYLVSQPMAAGPYNVRADEDCEYACMTTYPPDRAANWGGSIVEVGTGEVKSFPGSPNLRVLFCVYGEGEIRGFGYEKGTIINVSPNGDAFMVAPTVDTKLMIAERIDAAQ